MQLGGCQLSASVDDKAMVIRFTDTNGNTIQLYASQNMLELYNGN